ncbi:C1 family peptidase [Carboxylicivirga linearis]|uniref:Aminopeptidase n=1 Tax=Carboxylicivirga linearis TaxID=1628157 RepID=A0ABS5JUS3_9BACT|nr:C1 family peptidase [Carboxylicivirga linearis]MBS2098607.1 aminopeptidase [Carboxylicivirga linearis]
MKILMTLCMVLFSVAIIAQDEAKGFEFETIYDLEATCVKDQYRSGTCWSFSGLGFFESEMIRLGKNPANLSEMFVVRHCYSDKAEKYVRLHGSLNFGGGGAFHDVVYVMKKYGMVPEEVYGGLNYGEEKHVHGEMDEVLKAYVDAVIKNKNKKLTTAWKNGYEGILDAYLGEMPESFEVDGKTYTPQTYLDDVIGINPDDYIQVSSYSHHPFYSKFIIEVPDNWMWGEVYNVPMDDLMSIFNNSLENGYSIGWAADVSEKGFSYRNGLAIVPESNIEELADSEQSKWEAMTPAERNKRLYSFEEPVTEKVITQEMRQEAFDNYETTDDHGMQITGMVKDQNGTVYYKVKNSWNTGNKYDGYIYASEAFVKYKTMSIMIHKDALTKDLKKKLGVK